MSSVLPPLVLASGSPRRRELLEGLGRRFEVRPVDVDETPRPGEEAEDYVRRLAVEKAAAAPLASAWILAADTVVAIDGELLGKPSDDREAAAMLRRLSGREHRVLTAVALRAGGRQETATAVETTRVRFVGVSERDIDWYVATGEPRDKAGAYAIQGAGGLFVESITGSYSNVVGLPLATVHRLCRQMGVDLLSKQWSRSG